MDGAADHGPGGGMDGAPMTAVNVAGVMVTYPGADRPVLDGVDLDLADGGLTVLLGPSGCGKSTLLRVIAGLIAPDAGDVCIGGASMRGVLPERRGAVMVAQGGLLFPHMTVAENVGFGLRMRGMAQGAVAAAVDAVLAQVQLAGFGARRPAALSGGQAQRVALARALVVRPRVLLLDEPLSSLDAHLRRDMRDLIRGLQRDSGITTLLVTHDLIEATAMADRLALMLDGRIRQVGAPEAVYARPVDRDVARFFGAVTFVPGRAHGGVFDCALGQIRVPDDARDGPGALVIRADAVQMGAGENALTGVVRARVFLAGQVRLDVQAGAVSLQVMLSLHQAAGMEVGASVALHVPRDGLWVVD